MGIGGAGAYVGGVAGVPARGGITGAGIGRGGAIAGGAIAGGGVGSAIERRGASAGGATAGGATAGGATAGGATWICGVCTIGCMGREVATGGVIPVGNRIGCAGLLYCFKVASTLDHS